MCHGVDIIVDKKLDRNGWKDMVQKMVGYGMQMSDKEVDLTADYLSKNFGAQAPPPSGGADEKAALRFINGICSSCHDAELIRGTQGTKQEWLAIVKNMNEKGSGLSEKDSELLVNYLSEKYPKK
jgi:hypothetical protein